MQLRRLRYFVTVAEEMHFGRAAQRLNMEREPLAAHVRELEREIGHDLFEGSDLQIRLTPAGQTFLREAQTVLARSASAVKITRHSAKGETGIVRIGSFGRAMERVLPEVIRALRRAHPTIDVHLRAVGDEQQLRALDRDEIDVAFVYRPVDTRAFDLLDVAEEELLAVVPADHPQAQRDDRVPIGELALEPLVLVSRERHPAIASVVDEALRAASIAITNTIPANNRSTALALVAHGLGIALLPEHATVPRRDVAYLRLETPVRLQLAAVWSKRAGARSARQRFVDTLAALVSGGTAFART